MDIEIQKCLNVTDTKSGKIYVYGNTKESYIPGKQWIHKYIFNQLESKREDQWRVFFTFSLQKRNEETEWPKMTPLNFPKELTKER